MSTRPRQILLTGGTGSFGHAFVRRMLREEEPCVVRIYSRDELKQYEMAQRFENDPRLRFLIGDVRDRERLARAMHGADLVVHAAAMKQVPLCEYNPAEAVKTNVMGAQNVVDCAIDMGVPRTVALSTDKAVNPCNLYGATKLCAEKIFVQGNVYAGPQEIRFACVRYGNVVGSRGSVIPLFRKQAETGVLTVTDTRMTRFWISLEQAVELVLFAEERMTGGEIFVPKIPSMRIVDLARAIAPDAMCKEIGIRPGEKLHEMLLTPEETASTREYPTHYVVGGREPQPGGRAVPERFGYSSDTNTQWLEVDQLADLVGGLETGLA
ncbi:MAG: UDP-N-acetylglucosamine 4,6-dehydratase (inverting) [Myxococcota bacterium]